MKSDLYCAIEKAWDELAQSSPREKTAPDDPAFHEELLNELEGKWGKRFVAQRRSIVVDGAEYQLPITELYKELEGSKAFRQSEVQWQNREIAKRNRQARFKGQAKPQLDELMRQGLSRPEAVKRLAEKYNVTPTRVNQIIREES